MTKLIFSIFSVVLYTGLTFAQSNTGPSSPRHFFVFDVRSGTCYALDASDNIYRVEDPLFKCDKNSQPRKEYLIQVNNPDLGEGKRFALLLREAKANGYTILECTNQVDKNGNDRCYGARAKQVGGAKVLNIGHIGYTKIGNEEQIDNSLLKPDKTLQVGRLDPIYKPEPVTPPAPAPVTADKEPALDLKPMEPVKAPEMKPLTPMVELPADFGKEKDVEPPKPMILSCKPVKKAEGHFIFDSECPKETLLEEYQRQCLYKGYCKFNKPGCDARDCDVQYKELKDAKVGYYNNVKEKLEELYKAQNNFRKTNKKFMDCSASETEKMYKKLDEAQQKVKKAKAAYIEALKTFNDEAKDKISKGGFACVDPNAKDFYTGVQYVFTASSHITTCVNAMGPEVKERYLNGPHHTRKVDSVPKN